MPRVHIHTHTHTEKDMQCLLILPTPSSLHMSLDILRQLAPDAESHLLVHAAVARSRGHGTLVLPDTVATRALACPLAVGLIDDDDTRRLVGAVVVVTLEGAVVDRHRHQLIVSPKNLRPPPDQDVDATVDDYLAALVAMSAAPDPAVTTELLGAVTSARVRGWTTPRHLVALLLRQVANTGRRADWLVLERRLARATALAHLEPVTEAEHTVDAETWRRLLADMTPGAAAVLKAATRAATSASSVTPAAETSSLSSLATEDDPMDLDQGLEAWQEMQHELAAQRFPMRYFPIKPLAKDYVREHCRGVPRSQWMFGSYDKTAAGSGEKHYFVGAPLLAFRVLNVRNVPGADTTPVFEGLHGGCFQYEVHDDANHPIILFADCEFDIEFNPGVDRDVMLARTLAAAEHVYRRLVGPDAPPLVWSIETAHQDGPTGKVSFHLKGHRSCGVMPGMHAQKAFWAQVAAYGGESLLITKKKGERKCFVDSSVYSRDHLFRVLGGTKRKPPYRYLVPQGRTRESITFAEWDAARIMNVDPARDRVLTVPQEWIDAVPFSPDPDGEEEAVGPRWLESYEVLTELRPFLHVEELRGRLTQEPHDVEAEAEQVADTLDADGVQHVLTVLADIDPTSPKRLERLQALPGDRRIDLDRIDQVPVLPRPRGRAKDCTGARGLLPDLESMPLTPCLAGMWRGAAGHLKNTDRLQAGRILRALGQVDVTEAVWFVERKVPHQAPKLADQFGFEFPRRGLISGPMCYSLQWNARNLAQKIRLAVNKARSERNARIAAGQVVLSEEQTVAEAETAATISMDQKLVCPVGSTAACAEELGLPEDAELFATPVEAVYVMIHQRIRRERDQ